MLLTVKQVAERLNCCESQVYALLGAGELPYIRIGLGKQGGKRIDEADLEELPNSRRYGGRPRAFPPGRLRRI